MKIIKREITSYKEVYISKDGREFENKTDCETWEKSYRCTLDASWKNIKKVEANSVDLGLPWGSEDHECYIIKPIDLDEITFINAYINGTTCNVGATLDTKHIGKLVALNFGFDHDYCDCYVLDKHIENVTNYVAKMGEKLEEV